MLSLYLKHGNALSKKAVAENDSKNCFLSPAISCNVWSYVLWAEDLVAPFPRLPGHVPRMFCLPAIADPLASCAQSWTCAFHVLFPEFSYSPRLQCLISHVEVQLFLRPIPLRLLWIRLKLAKREKQRGMKTSLLRTWASNSGLPILPILPILPSFSPLPYCSPWQLEIKDNLWFLAEII